MLTREGLRLGSNEGSRLNSGCPRNGVTADSVANEDVGTPLTIIYKHTELRYMKDTVRDGTYF